MEYKYILIPLLIYILFLFSNLIANLIINSDLIKDIITRNINKYAKKIDLSKSEINPGYMTSIYDLDLYLYDIKNDDYSIFIFDLRFIELKLKKLKGYFMCKFSLGPNYYISLEDEVTIDFDNIILNYTLLVYFYPFELQQVTYGYEIIYELKSEKTIIKYFLRKGVDYFKEKINEKISAYLEKVPELIQTKMKRIVKEYDYIFKILRYYVLIFGISEIFFALLLYYAKTNLIKLRDFIGELIKEIKKIKIIIY